MPEEISIKRLGAKRSRFDRKAWYYTARAALKSSDLSSIRPPIKNQGETGSCVGMDLSSVGTSEATRAGVTIPRFHRFSETDIYNGGRGIDGTLQIDCGTYLSSALEWIRAKRFLPYEHWQYKEFEKQLRPSSLDQHAEPYPMLSYYRIVNGNDGILGALADGHIVSFAGAWPKKWMSTKDGLLPTPKKSDIAAGGHAWYIYKSSVEDEFYDNANSWGESSWSYSGRYVPKGCFRFGFDCIDWFKNEGGYDAHIVIVEWGKPPEPEPQPIDTAYLRHQVSTDSGETWQVTTSV